MDRYGLDHLVGDTADVEEADVTASVDQKMIAFLAGANEAVNQTAVFAYPPVDATSLKVVAAAVPALTITVTQGAGFVNAKPVHLTSNTVKAIAGCGVLPRIDTIVLDEDGEISIVTGTAAAIPVAPALEDDQMALADVTHVVGETVIKDTADGSNGYITDRRVFCNL